MSELGRIAVLFSLLIAGYSALAALAGTRARMPELVQSARHGVLAVCGLMTAASVMLLASFLTHDFSNRYVYEHSSRDMPVQMIGAAFYSGQQGSLLYWAWTLSIFSAVVIVQNWRRNRELMPYVIAVLMGVELFFTLMLGVVASPFERMPRLVSDGLGLNPLLYDTGMLYHPPMLLAGYMSWSVPFAFGVAALATGRLDAEWIRATRRYALVAWIILGIGNLLGSWWAYHVLGWGGYWGWDPVENAAIMPWLTGTAYLHSVMIQERRGMLKIWNLALILITFFLAIFGTFIVRSGVISSVHSFAQSSVGPYYLSFLSLVIVGSLVLLFWRMPRLRSDNRLDSVWSREAAFVVNNLLFLGVTFAIFWGSVFPLASEAIQGTKLTVGPPYFNQTAGPIFLLLVFLMGIGPLLPWRRGTREHLVRILRAPVAAATLVMGLSVVFDVRQAPVAIAVWVCAFVVASISGEFHRGALARRSAAGEAYPRALLSLIARNNRRYGGYIVHLGVVMISVAVIGSSFYQVERQVALKPGESVDVGPYHVTYEQLHQRQEYGARVVETPLRVERDGRLVETALPGKRFYKNFERQPASNVSIQSGPLDDLYIVLAGWQELAPNTPDPNGPVSLLLFVNPLVIWLWVGGIVLAVGTLVAAWPEPGRVLAPATLPSGVHPAVGRA